MKPILKKVKKEYNLGNITIIADKGNNSGENLEFIHSSNSKYVISQRIRNRRHKLSEIVFDEQGYIYNHDNSFKFKTVESIKEYNDVKIKEHIKRRIISKAQKRRIDSYIQKVIDKPSLL